MGDILILFDSHMHTKFSTDSKMNIEDAIKKANELNIGITTTEHMDLNYPIPGDFVFDPKEYLKEYSKYRNDKVLLGIELGMIADQMEDNKKIIDDNPFDYVIGSIHLIDGIDLYDKAFYKGKTKNQAYEQYFTYMLQCLRSHNFIDSLAHIDFISRYSVYEDKEIHYEHFAQYIDEILKTVVQNNISLELNTRRLNNQTAAENLMKIYKRFYELGGRTVTIGSDAHNAATIGSNYAKAQSIAESCNLKTVYFKERKPEYCSVN